MPAPKHQPTDDQRNKAKQWSAVGVTHDDIALRLNIALKTLYKHYHSELKLGKAEANCAIGGKLFAMAMAGNITALIYWTKSQMGWREVQVVETIDRSPEKAVNVWVSTRDPLAASAAYSDLMQSQPTPDLFKPKQH